jgi:hypothetical protein
MRIASKFVLAVAALVAASTTGVQAQDAAPPPKNQCFFVTQFENWKAPDARTIYIRTTMNKYYRLDLSGTCSELTWPDSHLVTHWRGTGAVCSAVDWDLRVSDGHGMVTPCIVRTMTQLTPDEVAAIPKKFKP